MPAMHCTTRSVLSSALAMGNTRGVTLPAFLLPSLTCAPATVRSPQSPMFSTTSVAYKRKAKVGLMDRLKRNPMIRMSALRRTGLNRYHKRLLEVDPKELPKPVPKTERSVILIDEDHGLWDFFPKHRSTMATPTELSHHGRSWEISELRRKDWDDLHRLWWVCIKELNRLKTYEVERERIGHVYGEYEGAKRTETIEATMRAIKFTLTERFYAWENARVEAMEDKEVDLYANVDEGEPAYNPEQQFEYEIASQSPTDAKETSTSAPAP